jgi:acyl carrier protein
MVPARLLLLDRLPLTPNGKLDRSALPEPGEVEGGKRAVNETAAEEIVAGIWAETLRLDSVGPNDDFFELGGHSLLATQVVSRVREAFDVELHLLSLFESPTVRGFARRVEEALAAGQTASPPIERAERGGSMPLSFAQQRLWFLNRLEPESAFYHCPVALRLRGALDTAALGRTLREIIRRHEVLRTSFAEVGGRPAQSISPASNFALPLEDLSHLEAEEREQEARRLARREAEHPFDLSAGPLLRARLLRLSEEEHVAVFTMHHIVSDGWSMGVLVREVSALYEAFSQGRESPLADLLIQYADYAVWQREWLRGEVLERQLCYWRERLRGAPPVLELPTDRERPAVQSFRGAHLSFTLDAGLSEGLRLLSRRAGVTLYMTLLAGCQALLHRLTGERRLSVGTPVAGRTRVEAERLIGFFVNMLVMHSDLSDDPTFSELLRRARETALGAYAHQDVPFERLVEELQPERRLEHSPLIQVWFVLQNAPISKLELTGLSLSILELENSTAKFDLGLNVVDTEEGLAVTLEYKTDLFNADTAGHILRQYETLLRHVVVRPEVKLGELVDILSRADEQLRREELEAGKKANMEKLKGARRRPQSLRG